MKSYKIDNNNFIKGFGNDYESNDLGQLYENGKPRYKIVDGKHELTTESDFYTEPTPPTQSEIDAQELAQKVKDLQNTDAGFIRDLDDIINALIYKVVIEITDLPTVVQDKLNDREIKRQNL